MFEKLKLQAKMIENQARSIGQKGQLGGFAGLFLGLIVIIMLAVIGGVIVGQTYQNSQTQITAISDVNVRTNVNTGIIYATNAFSSLGNILTLVVVVAALVGVLVLFLRAVGGVGQGGGL